MQIETSTRYHYPPIKWPKYGTLVTQNTNKVLEQQEFFFIAGEDAKWLATLGDNLAISYKTKHIFTIKFQ